MTSRLSPAFADGSVTVYHGDVREVLRLLPAASIDCCVTSPPYWGLRDYGLPPSTWGGDFGCPHRWGRWAESHDQREASEHGKSRTTNRFYGDPSRRFNGNHQRHSAGTSCVRCDAWRGCLGLEPTPELYVEHLVEVFRAVRRVLKPSGSLWLNLGDCYDAGTSAARIASRTAEHGYWKNPAISLRPKAGLKPKDLMGMPWRVAFALQEDGWWLRSDIIWAKPNPMPESVRDRPTRAHEYVFLLAPSARYLYDDAAAREPVTGNAHPRGHGVNPKAATWPAGWSAEHGGHGGIPRGRYRPKQNASFAKAVGGLVATRNRRTVWTIPTQPYRGSHFATFPERLVEPCILAGSSAVGCCPECAEPLRRVTTRRRTHDGEPRDDLGAWRNADPGSPIGAQGDGHWRYATEVSTRGWQRSCDHQGAPVPAVVLDPFAGSGTTLAVAARLGRRAVGVELKADYLPLIKRRCGRETARRKAA
ncbi:MAG TPA: site-specific DNA-methyltransferase [Solirubrobacterales bacterium]|jgi:DNA modification methylase